MCISRSVNIVIIAVFPLFVAGMLSSSSYARIDSESIVGIWLFDEGDGDIAGDSSKNGNDGTLNGNLDWVDGKFSTAISFPGIRSNSVSIPHTDAMSLATFTVTAWINMEKLAFQTVVGKYAGGDDANYDIQIRSNGCVKMWVFFGGQGIQATENDLVVTDAEWHHVAGTCDETVAKIYIDGMLKGEVAVPAGKTPDMNDSPITIGGSVINSYQGLVDEVGLFNVALSEEDIASIMNDGLAKATGATPVSPAGTLTTTWGRLRR